MQAFLCGWHLYLAVLAALLAKSAAPGSWLGRGARVSAVVALVLLANLYGAWLASRAVLAAEAGMLLVGAWGLLRADRADTRYIALFLTAAAILPVALYFWAP